MPQTPPPPPRKFLNCRCSKIDSATIFQHGKANCKSVTLYCSACVQGTHQDKHACFQNWDASSSEMETDIILDGFLKAEQMHGVRYTRFIGDGDSSVFPTLRENIPIWGHDIQKVKCANHACKCYRSSLEKLVTNNPFYKGKDRLTEKMRKCLTNAACCEINITSKEADRNVAGRLIEQDLNSPFHSFG